MLDAACESICCAKQASFFHSKHHLLVRVTAYTTISVLHSPLQLWQSCILCKTVSTHTQWLKDQGTP